MKIRLNAIKSAALSIASAVQDYQDCTGAITDLQDLYETIDCDLSLLTKAFSMIDE